MHPKCLKLLLSEMIVIGPYMHFKQTAQSLWKDKCTIKDYTLLK